VNIKAFILCHPKEIEQTRIVAQYYRQFMDVEVSVKDFMLVKEHEARNEGLEKLKDCDFVLTVDSDEIICIKDMEWIVSTKGTRFQIFLAKLIDYMLPDEVLKTQREHCPVILVKPNIKFYENRCIYGEAFVLPIEIHHLSCIFNDRILRNQKRYKDQGLSEYAGLQNILSGERKKITPPKEVSEIIGKILEVYNE